MNRFANNPRRIIHWERVKGPRAVSAVTIGTAFGAGLFPIAPGTMGTLAAVPLVYATNHSDLVFRVVLWTVILAAGIWASKVFDELMGSKDNQNIVIDEVVGLGITAWTAGTHASTLVAAFLLFRFFDVLKPPPVRQVDNWSRKKATGPKNKYTYWWSGFGVMMDDVLAGFQGLAVILILQHFNLLP